MRLLKRKPRPEEYPIVQLIPTVGYVVLLQAGEAGNNPDVIGWHRLAQPTPDLKWSSGGLKDGYPTWIAEGFAVRCEIAEISAQAWEWRAEKDGLNKHENLRGICKTQDKAEQACSGGVIQLWARKTKPSHLF